MKPLVIIALLLMLLASVIAGETGSLKKHGASWAKLSDEAQIQLLIDELRSAATDAVRRAALREQVLKNSSVLQIRNTPATALRIDGDLAYASLQGQQITLQKSGGEWQVVAVVNDGVAGEVRMQVPLETGVEDHGFSAGETFIKQSLSTEYGIETLSESVTRNLLDRQLFGAPEKTASYYVAHYRKSAPFVSSTYVQFVIDPAWNRVVYGSLDNWLKTYDNVEGPSAIAVDADGRVFIAESGAKRITVLKFDAQQENSSLTFLYAIEDLANPVAISLDDNGTPLQTEDDLLYVADAATNQVLKYALESNAANRVAEFDGFDGPSALASGRWNGTANDLLYVIDKVGKRVQLFKDDDGSLQHLRTLKGSYEQYFSDIKSDHFGNIYLVDNVRSTIYKYTSALELLDYSRNSEDFQGLVNADVPFGRITVEGEGEYWSGFDQLLTLERWSESSGAQRRTLGLAIRNASFQSDTDVSEIVSRFTLTDFGDVDIQVLDENENLVSELPGGWMVSGSKELVWNRRDAAGEQVAPGSYRVVLQAGGSYSEEKTVLETRLYLPLYYQQIAGSEVDNRFLVNGETVRWGSDDGEVAVQDRRRVGYRFGGLNPESDYQVRVEALSGDGAQRRQVVMAGKSELAEMTLERRAVRTGWLSIPKEAYAEGVLDLSVARITGETAMVSQLWLKETGVGLDPEQLNADPVIPDGYVLEQNYPNPFNPSTTIGFQLPQDVRVKLQVFNLLGQKVRTLVDGPAPAGSNSVLWDGRNEAGATVSSGIYFYRLEAGSIVKTKQMLLIK